MGVSNNKGPPLRDLEILCSPYSRRPQRGDSKFGNIFKAPRPNIDMVVRTHMP